MASLSKFVFVGTLVSVGVAWAGIILMLHMTDPVAQCFANTELSRDECAAQILP